MDINQGDHANHGEQPRLKIYESIRKGDFARPCFEVEADGTQQVGRENVSGYYSHHSFLQTGLSVIQLLAVPLLLSRSVVPLPPPLFFDCAYRFVVVSTNWTSTKQKL
jgi:hypothetical protein